MRIKDLPELERPRERLVHYGEEALTLRELLAVLLSSGQKGRSSLEYAQDLLGTFGSLEGIKGAGMEELSHVPGIGLAQACRIKAALELGKRLTLSRQNPRRAIKTGGDIVDFCRPWFHQKEKECFLTLALDAKHRVLRLFLTATGSLLSCPVHPREVFRPLIREGAVAFAVAHNHPSSGDPEPSQEDLEITKRLAETGKTLGIPLVDHVIVGADRYVSLSDRRLMDD